MHDNKILNGNFLEPNWRTYLWVYSTEFYLPIICSNGNVIPTSYATCRIFFYHILTRQFQIMAHFSFGKFSTILRYCFQVVTCISFSRCLHMWYIWVFSNGINLVSRTVFYSLININLTSNHGYLDNLDRNEKTKVYMYVPEFRCDATYRLK